MINADIQVNGNIMTGRQGFAYTYNSMKYPILVADVDKEQEYGKDGYCTFGKVRVMCKLRMIETAYTCTLEAENGEWSLGGSGCCLKSGFGFHDMLNHVEESQIPVVKKDQIVVIAMVSKKGEYVLNRYYKVGDVDIHCTTVARLIPLTDEEMKEIEADAHKWCH